MDWNALVDAAKAENKHGIEVRRGKKYTTVAIRVEVMRRHAGALGIATEIVHWSADSGSPVVVKATVTDEAGRVLATGHAEEIRGKGQVNSTSALENAETSAIGRALAALGLSGGEFASANEMDGVERKREAQDDTPKFSAPATLSRILKAIASRDTKDDLTALWKHESDALGALKDADPQAFQSAKDAFAKRGEEIANAGRPKQPLADDPLPPI